MVLIDCREQNKYRSWLIAAFLVFVFTLYTSIYFVRKSNATQDAMERRLGFGFNEDKSSSNNINKVIVKIASGSLEGKRSTVFSSTIYEFLGIPYAEPPTGKLRFSSPEPVKPWFGLKTALKYSPMCPQIIFARNIVPINYISEDISEDCLTINIWTPDIKPKQLKTVMIWIHGGDFSYNSANLHETDGRVLASFGDVVVVTVNYRLGVFGFLNTRNEEAPGNMGIYDQSLALHWIKGNIKRFGGDPQKLVPFGEGAGAISIGILMSFNNTKNLFSRAITQSGSLLLPQSSKTFQYTVELAQHLNCLNEENATKIDSFSDEEVQCLKSSSFDDILEASKMFDNKTLMPFIPSVDSFYEDIESAIDYTEDENAFTNVKELMSGLVKDEGTFFMHTMNPKIFKKQSFPQIKTLNETREMFFNLVNNKTDFPEQIITMVANSFIDGSEKDSPKNNIGKLSRALADFLIVCPTIYLAEELITRNKSVYMYLYNHRPKNNDLGEWFGVSHYQEVPFVFGYPLRKLDLYSKQDIIFSERIMKIWSNFAKTGKVFPQLELIWPKYSDDNSFMVLNPKQSSIINHLNSKSCELYKTFIKANGR